MGKRGRAPQPLPYFCPRPEHEGSEIRSRGYRTNADGTRVRRLLCRPVDDDSHWFEVDVTTDSTHIVRPQKCEKHPDGTVRRDGVYSRSGHPRQRYRCFPKNGDRSHVFTPVTPRQNVESGEHCDSCAEVRSVHAGEVTAGRGHHYTARQVAEA